MKQTKEKIVPPLVRNNKVAMLAHFFNVLVVLIFTVADVFLGELSATYLIISLILAFTPDVICLSSWKKDHESQIIKHMTAIGFALFYTFTLLTSGNHFIYIFCVPMMLAYSVYNDMRGSLMVSSGVVLFNIIAVFIGATTGKLGYMGSQFAAAQITMILLVSIYSIFVAKTSDANFSYVLSNLASVTKEMELGIADVHEELVKLNNSSAATVNAMQEVSIGTNDTAEAVQNQLLQTQSIQNKIDLVSKSTSLISDNMQATLSVLQEGNRNVSILVEKVDTSVQSGEIVAEKLQELEQSVAEMNSIVDFINKIAKKTSLLSYNASIEAAHAGDFGKGFAVVASEIAEMATQTNDATTDITDLIKNTSEVITEVVSVIHNMIDDIKEEKHSTDSTADSFAVIRESTLSVRDNIESLSEHIHDLKEANTLIADSVQMVSAVSEEVSAHASETSAAEEENATILARIDERMQSLLDVIER